MNGADAIPGLPKVLYLAHALPPEELSGTPLITLAYANEMAGRGWSVTVLYGSSEVTDWDAVAPRKEDGEEFVRIAVPAIGDQGPFWSLCAASEAFEPTGAPSACIERVLDDVAPDLLHVVDNVNLPLDWPERAAARGIPVVRTVSCVEDLCGLIAPVSPLSDSVGYCLPPLTPDRCARCVASTSLDHASAQRLQRSLRKPPQGGVALPASPTDARGAGDFEVVATVTELLERKRARAVAQYTETFTRVIFSSRRLRAYFERSLPLDPSRVRIVPIGIDPTGVATSPRRDGPVVFAYAGALDEAKGLNAISDAFLHVTMLARNDYELVLFGRGDEGLIAELLAGNSRVTWRGGYEPQDLPELLADVSVGLSTSRFETFHRVTREYLFAGIPVIGSTTFGIPEVIRHGYNGLLFDHAVPGALLRAVTACLDDPALLARLTEGADATAVRSVRQEVDQLVGIYQECV
jgi:glycosyltransferase involved in cell wall biosynthesis